MRVNNEKSIFNMGFAAKPDQTATDFMPLQQLAGKLFPACSEVENA